ncbi:MAG: ABC transporter substrate-binding protein [Nitrososphaerales archaeon]
MKTFQSNTRLAISRMATIGIVVILVIAAGVGAAYYLSTSSSKSTTSTTTTPTTTSSPTSTSTGVLTYETANTPEYLDPAQSYFSYDYTIFQQVYEQLLWYNGTNSGSVIPWLAQSYTASSNGMSYQFTLHSGIKFADGETLNSTAVYFSLNRLLVEDASTPVAHGIQASWILQQLLNKSLSSYLSSTPQSYGTAYVKAVLGENFVQVTGPDTFTINVMTPNAAFPFLLAGEWASILAPSYVMQHDLALWTQSSNGYTLPYPTLSGTMNNQIQQYLDDLSATCNSGATPAGCAATYLDGSYSGSSAGTGPYVITSYSPNTSDFVLTANPSYWGSPTGKLQAQIKTIDINFVSDITTRELDLQNAAKSGQAMVIDPDASNLYDIANRTAWLNSNQLVSTISGVSLYGPYTALSVLFDPFETNVTNPLTGSYYTFQPFADQRLRLAFSDAVNITDIMATVNNKLGETAINAVAPGLPPAGSFFPNDKPAYSYSLDNVQKLLLAAMETPLTSFNFVNGTKAKAGVFDNSFGCTTLNNKGVCSSPVGQNIQLVFATGDTVDEAILETIASNINNVSITYNMGLTVSVVPLPIGQMIEESSATHLYMYALGWFADYPWVLDFTNAMYGPSGTYPAADGWNLGSLSTLYAKSQADSAASNLTALVQDVHQQNLVANNAVMYLWTQYPLNFMAMTSNIAGFYYNTALSTPAAGGTGPEYFATLYIK